MMRGAGQKTTIRLHHCHETRSMRSLWLLNELGVDYNLSVYPFDKTLRSDGFKLLHPVGRVPVLEIAGEVLWETGAITQYLCARFPERGLGRGPDDLDWPDWLVWVHFAETVSQHSAALTQQHIALYDDSMRSPVVMRLEAKRLQKCYEAIEARLSTPVENRDYLLTSGFSAADVSVGQAIYMSRHFARIEPYPELARWYERLAERPAFREALPPAGAERLYRQDFYEPWEDDDPRVRG